MHPRLGARLVARDAELAALTASLDSAVGGDGGLVVVWGEAGIGKSTLAAALRDEAVAQGLVVALGRAAAGPAGAMRPIVEALLSATRHRALPDTPHLRPFQAVLDGLLSGNAAAGGSASPEVLGETVLRTLTSLSRRRGVLLVLEDLHWADPDTVSVVEHLADHTARSDVLAVVTIRSGGDDHAAAVVRSLASRHAAAELRLVPFDVAATAALVEDRLGRRPSDDLVRTVQSRSDGVPFLVEQLLLDGDAERAGVPRSFAVGIDDRLRALPTETCEALEAAAVLGRSFEVSLLAATLARPAGEVLASLRPAVDAQVLERIVDGVGRFRHALTRDAVSSRLLPADRADVAGRAAAVLGGSRDLDADGHRMAARLSEVAGDRPSAVRSLVAAGRFAVRGGALRTAIQALRDAAHLADDRQLVDVEEVLLEALASAAQVDEALRVGASLLERLGRRDAPPSQVAAIHLTLAHAATEATRVPEAQRHLRRARELLPGSTPTPTDSTAVALDVIEARLSLDRGRLDDAVALAVRALEAAEVAGLPGLACDALEVLGRRHRLRDLTAARSAFEQQLRTADAHDLALQRLRAMHELGTIDMLTDADPRRLEQARDLAAQAGALALTATLELQLSGLHGMCFRPQPALEAADRCLDLARPLGLQRIAVTGLVQRAFAHVTAADADAAERALTEAADLAGPDAEVEALTLGHCRGTLALLQERRRQALEALDAAMDAVDRMDAVPIGAFSGLWAIVATLERGGEIARARLAGTDVGGHALVPEFLEVADAIARGRVGDSVAASRQVEEATASLARHGMAHLRALVLRLAAEAAIEDGWGEPTPWLHSAIEVFDGGPHQVVAEAARALLRRVGAPTPTRPDAVVPAALAALGVTAREREVLDLVADHLTNAEIAERLFLSVRTVEKHVERLLRKTGATDRRALVRRWRDTHRDATT